MKSRIGTNDPKKRRRSFQLLAEPSPTKAFRVAPWKPKDHAASATSGANAGQVDARLPPVVPTTGGWYFASSRNASAAVSGSSAGHGAAPF